MAKALSISNAIVSDLYKSSVDRLVQEYKIQQILTYMPIRGEVDVVSFLETSPITIGVPKVLSKDTMSFYALTKDRKLIKSSFGILEPIGLGQPLLPDDQTLILIPGVLYDKKGHRWGYGGGYYDRFLSEFPRGIKVGVTYEELLQESIESKKHDVAMDYILTENNLYKCS